MPCSPGSLEQGRFNSLKLLIMGEVNRFALFLQFPTPSAFVTLMRPMGRRDVAGTPVLRSYPITTIQNIDRIHARASEYSWCNPLSIDLTQTERASSRRCRDFDKGTTRFGGGSGTPGPNAMCARP